MSKEKDIERWKESVKKANLKKDIVDDRDYMFRPSLSMLDRTPLPLKVDLRYLTPQVEHQGTLGSCVANAWVNLFEILLKKNNTFVDLSRLFLYYNVREPFPDQCCKDVGAYTREGGKDVAARGICKTSLWPYDPSKVNDKPSEEAYTEALTRKVDRYERIYGFDDGPWHDDNAITYVKIALAKGFPVVISMDLTMAFYDIDGPLSSHVYEGRLNGDSSIGGHAMCIVGYDDDLGGFIVENSWGTNWGDEGFWLLKYELTWLDIRDLWTVTAFDGIFFTDDWEPDHPLKNAPDLVFNMYHEDSVDGYSPMLCTVQGGEPPLEYAWHMDSFVLETALKHSTSRLAYFRTNPSGKTYDGIVHVSDASGASIQQKFSVILNPGHNPNNSSQGEEFARRLYEIYLERDPDEAGIYYWGRELDNNIITGEGIVQSFNAQPEFISKHYSTRQIVTKTYQVMLQREPDEAGLAYWMEQYDREKNINNITGGFAHSTEFVSLCGYYSIKPY